MTIRMLLPLVALLLATLAAAEPAPAEAAAPAPAPAAADAATHAPVPRFSRFPIPACGCAIYAPKNFELAAPTKSEDGADVWQGQLAVGDWNFGAIVVKFTAPADATGEQLEELLIGYLDFLKGQFSVATSAGVGRGHTHSENPAARGVIDFWQGKDGETWAVKGWVDNSRLAVLLIQGRGDYPYPGARQIFLDGFRFTE